MRRITCDRCGKKYALKDEPLSGRKYRLTCKVCGNSFVVQGPEPEHPNATPTEELLSTAGTAAAEPTPTPTPVPAAAPPPVPVEPLEVAAVAAPTPASSAAPEQVAAAPPPAPTPAKRVEPRYVDLFADVDAHEQRGEGLTPERGFSDAPPPFTPKPAAVPAAPARAAGREPAAPRRRSERPLVLIVASLLGAFLLGVVGLAFWRGLARKSEHPAPAVAEPAQPSPPPATEPPPPPPSETAAAAPAPSGPPGGAPSPAEIAPAPAPPPAPSAPEASPPPPAAQPAARAPSKPEKAPARPARPPPAKHAVARVEPKPPPPPAPAAKAPPPAAPEPAPAAREPQLPDSLSPEQVQRTIASAKRSFDACLKDPWRGVEQASGARQVTLRLVVGPDGAVSYSTIDDVTISSAPVGQCLKAAARGLQFAQFSGDPLKIDHPITIPAR